MLCLLGCEQSPADDPVISPNLPITREKAPAPEKVYSPKELTKKERRVNPRPEKASIDYDYDIDGEVESRRLVYQVTLRLPLSLGDLDKKIPRAAAELHIDVSESRLRARFVGKGWPVAEGAEIRIRRDQPGVYVFDEFGGRPLGPGQMAQWFEGGRLRLPPSFRINPPRRLIEGPGALVCRLIAEWINESPENLARRCGPGGSTPSFRVGLWRAKRTAAVRMELPYRALRADSSNPPRKLSRGDSGLFLTPALLGRIRRDTLLPPGHVPTVEEGLLVKNHSGARMVIAVQGQAIGWVDADTDATFVGLRPGVYQIGGMRPFGLQTAQLRSRFVPGTASLPR